jgi:hypothetical protein
MSPELTMWFVLATKMAVTALFVTAATIIAERSVQREAGCLL